MNDETSETYEASVAIWKGIRPVANGGWLTIAGGHVTLEDGKGKVVGEGPASSTWAKSQPMSMGSGIACWIEGQRFMLSPGSGNRPKITVLSAGNPGLGVGAASVAHGRAFASEFYAALEAAGGHKGKPS